MCVSFIMLDRCPGFPLAVLLNRDELYGRPTRPAHLWHGAAPFAAGQDERSGGTWAGVDSNGRFALLTNYRDLAHHRADARSRGEIVTRYLAGEDPPEGYLDQLRRRRGDYNGFNLVLGTREDVHAYSSIADSQVALGPGLYGLSNRALDDPWPKVLRGKRLLEDAFRDARVSEEQLLDLMLDTEKPRPEELPPTGELPVELEWELSSIFVRTPTYGTCSSTLIRVDRNGQPALVERTFQPGAGGYTTVRVSPRSDGKKWYQGQTPWPRTKTRS